VLPAQHAARTRFALVRGGKRAGGERHGSSGLISNGFDIASYSGRTGDRLRWFGTYGRHGVLRHHSIADGMVAYMVVFCHHHLKPKKRKRRCGTKAQRSSAAGENSGCWPAVAGCEG